MIIFIAEASHEQWLNSGCERWDIGGVFKSLEAAQDGVKRDNDGSSLEWQKQITNRGVGAWWVAYTHDEWQTVWRIIQLELEGDVS